jgi:hypothetical protein
MYQFFDKGTRRCFNETFKRLMQSDVLTCALERLGRVVVFLLCVREILGLNLRPEIRLH